LLYRGESRTPRVRRTAAGNTKGRRKELIRKGSRVEGKWLKGRKNVTRQVFKKWYGEETRLKVSFWNLEQGRREAESM
jgi:hypothetical protein